MYVELSVCGSLVTGAFRSAEGLFARPPSTRPIYSVTQCGRGSSNCTFNATAAPSTCSHDNDIGVFCREEGTPAVCRTGEVRLEGSSQPREIAKDGRVEICIDNQWGTICDDSWDERGVNLVCNTLFGESSSKSYTTQTHTHTHTHTT